LLSLLGSLSLKEFASAVRAKLGGVFAVLVDSFLFPAAFKRRGYLPTDSCLRDYGH
jgi:hypothetical protein